MPDGSNRGAKTIALLSGQVHKNADLRAGQTVLKAGEVLEFYMSDEKQAIKNRIIFRDVITNHISEWNGAINPAPTAVTAVGWQWQTQEAFNEWYRYIMPYLWCTKAIAKGVGLSEEIPFFWFYHPITFLRWLFESKHRRKTADGLTDKELQAKREEEAEAEAKGEMLNMHTSIDEDWQDVDNVSITEIDLPDDVPIEILNEQWKNWEQGEWTMEQSGELDEE